MARPREFEIDDALQDAMNVFWDRGYDGASLPDLLDGMNIARGSLYKAFGDKKRLFLKALTLYERDVLQPAIDLLRSPQQHGEASPIHNLFASVVETARRGDRRGCLMCNAAAGPAADDDDIGRVVAAMLKRLTDAFVFALKNEANRTVAKSSDHKRRAQLLTTSYVGLRVLTRSGAPVAGLEQAVASLLD